MMVTLLQHDRDGSAANSVLDQTMADQVMAALSDGFSRRIIASVIEQGKTVQEISTEQSIPLSTCYRRSKELADQGILFVERIVVTGDGKRYVVYKSSIKSVDVTSDFRGVTVKAEIPDDAVERFRLRRLSDYASFRTGKSEDEARNPRPGTSRYPSATRIWRER